jgi:muramoyltetrapeptide carboxypeptidase
MKRREFTALLGAGLSVQSRMNPSNPPPLVRPRRLKPGDTVGLITPATPVANPDALQRVARIVEHFGLRAKWGKHVARKAGYFGNPIEGRLDDLHAMFRDPEVAAVLPISGGYGAAQLLDRIDYDLIRRNPKIFAGYSDITALHLAIHQQTGLVTFHGPNVDSRFSEYTIALYRKALFESKPIGAITNPVESNRLRPEHPLRAVRPGKASGRLAGGNLTLISTLMGTPHELDARGAILFLEDIGEEPYRIDRMLTQLRLAGKFEQAAGVVFGECTECTPSEYKPFVAAGFSLGEVLDGVLGDLKIPVLFGLTIGHTADQATLPIGLRATLDADGGTLAIEESAAG